MVVSVRAVVFLEAVEHMQQRHGEGMRLDEIDNMNESIAVGSRVPPCLDLCWCQALSDHYVLLVALLSLPCLTSLSCLVVVEFPHASWD